MSSIPSAKESVAFEKCDHLACFREFESYRCADDTPADDCRIHCRIAVQWAVRRFFRRIEPDGVVFAVGLL
jgi:hypothetical protein